MDILTYTNTAGSMMAIEEIDGASYVLSNGGLALFPTDTVWTIGCAIEKPSAFAKMLNLKKSPSKYGLEILVESIDRLKEFVPNLHPKLETLLFYHTRPLTIVFKHAYNFPDYLLTEEGILSVRLVTDPFTRKLIQQLDKPIASTFATPNDELIPHSFGMVSSYIIQQMDYVVKYKQKDSNIGQPAVVITVTEEDELVFLRE